MLKDLPFITSATDFGKTSIIMNTEKELPTNKWYYITAEDHTSLPNAVYGTPIDISTSSSPWYGAQELTAMETQITPAAGHTKVKVVEVQRNMKPVAIGECLVDSVIEVNDMTDFTTAFEADIRKAGGKTVMLWNK